MSGRWEILEERDCSQKSNFYEQNEGPPHFPLTVTVGATPQLGNILYSKHVERDRHASRYLVFLSIHHLRSADTRPRSKMKLLCIPLPFGKKRGPTNEGIQLNQGGRGAPTSTPTAKELQAELDGEKANCTRLDEERRRAKAEAEELAEAKKKLEDEVRELKKRSETREGEVGKKDARINQLEKDMSKMQTKVRHAGR